MMDHENSSLSYTLTYSIESYTENDDITTDELKKAANYVILWIRLLACPVIIIGNGLIISVIIKYERMHTYTNAFVLSLAATDCIVGSIFIPCGSLQLLFGQDIYKNKYYSLFLQGPYLYTLYLQLMNQVLIATDRFIAIVFPFKYPLLVTRKSVTIIISVLWTLPLPGPVCFMIYWNK